MSDNQEATLIGVVSDTHCPESGTLPLKMLGELEKVDVIVHLGDFNNLKTYKEFQKIAPVVGVYGNMDEDSVRVLLPEKKTFEVLGYKIGLIHGWGPPKNLETRVAKAFDGVDIILYGHSHIPLSTKIDNTIVFNPGSPSMNRDGSGTYGMLHLGQTISCQIIRLDE